MNNGFIKLIEEEFKKNNINFDNSLDANYIDDSFGAVMICVEDVIEKLNIEKNATQEDCDYKSSHSSYKNYHELNYCPMCGEKL